MLGDLVYIVNSNDQIKQAFYPTKDKILHKYGTPDGYDVQHLTKKCYKCNGTGYKELEKCYSCNNGIFDNVWCELKRYTLGGHLFHSFSKRYTFPVTMNMRYGSPYPQDIRTFIDGYIVHEETNYNQAVEIFYLLLLLFDVKRFFKLLGDYSGRRNFYPLSFLSYVIKKTEQTKYKISLYYKWQIAYRIKFWSVDPDDDIPF